MAEITKSQVDAVIDRYFELRQEFQNKPPPTHVGRKLRERTRRQSRSFLSWCGNAGIDLPLQFLRSRFENAQHTGYTMNWLHLRNARCAVVWKEWREGEALVEMQAARLKREAGTATEQAVQELKLHTRSMEQFKARYVGREELCLTSIVHSGGYHPESNHCPRCPLAVRCAAALYQRHGFDVVALRAGRLTVLPADIAAAAVR